MVVIVGVDAVVLVACDGDRIVGSLCVCVRPGGVVGVAALVVVDVVVVVCVVVVFVVAFAVVALTAVEAISIGL